MTWTLIFIFSFVLVIGAVYYRVREDRRYLKKQVSEIISERVKKDIQKDRADFISRQQKFGKAMANAKVSTP